MRLQRMYHQCAEECETSAKKGFTMMRGDREWIVGDPEVIKNGVEEVADYAAQRDSIGRLGDALVPLLAAR